MIAHDNSTNTTIALAFLTNMILSNQHDPFLCHTLPQMEQYLKTFSRATGAATGFPTCSKPCLLCCSKSLTAVEAWVSISLVAAARPSTVWSCASTAAKSRWPLSCRPSTQEDVVFNKGFVLSRHSNESKSTFHFARFVVGSLFAYLKAVLDALACADWFSTERVSCLRSFVFFTSIERRLYS